MTRLELMAAVAAIDVAVTVQAELKVDFTAVHFWTDSTCVLQWVRNPDLPLKLFVANRVAKLIEGSAGATWHYVNTRDNPADIGSRGLRPTQTAEITRWLEGPPWLKTGRSSWPTADPTRTGPLDPGTLELKVNLVVTPVPTPAAALV